MNQTRDPIFLTLFIGFICCFTGSGPSSAQTANDALSDLRFKFNFTRSKEVDQPFEKAATSLKEKYIGALERGMSKATTTGDLDSALLIKGELQEIKETAIGEAPATEPATESLATMRKVYRESLEGLQRDRAANLHRIAQAFLPELTAAEQTLTKSNDLDGALAVRAYRESLAAEFPDSPPPKSIVTPSTPLGATPRMTASGHELLLPVKTECRYGPDPSGTNDSRNDYHIIEANQGRGHLYLDFADQRFATKSHHPVEFLFVATVARVPNADTTDAITVRLSGEPVGSKRGARKGETLKISLNPAAIAANNPLQLEIACGGNAVILEATGKDAPYLLLKFE